MYPSRVQVRVAPLLLSPHSPLPPKAKLLQVTISVAVLIVVSHLSPGRSCIRLSTGKRKILLLGCGSR
jgi:hypothetical protein